MTQHLQATDKRKIEKLYLSGVKPGEIARKVGVKPASLRQHLYRAGLTKQRDAIEEVKRRTAREVLESIREKSIGDFEAVLGLLGEALKVDARKLRDGWGLVQDAAGASSLMRAKSLLQSQVFRHYGLDKNDESQQAVPVSLSLFCLPDSARSGVRKPNAKPVVAITGDDAVPDEPATPADRG